MSTNGVHVNCFVIYGKDALLTWDILETRINKYNNQFIPRLILFILKPSQKSFRILKCTVDGAMADFQDIPLYRAEELLMN